MAKLWARPVHGVLILAEGGGGGPDPLGPMLDPPLNTHICYTIVLWMKVHIISPQQGRRQPTLVGGARQDNVFARNLRAMACTYAHLRICVMYMKNHVHSAPQ